MATFHQASVPLGLASTKLRLAHQLGLEQADRSATTHLHTVQHEAKQAAAYATTLPLLERTQSRRNMWLQWPPGEHESLAATLATSYTCC